MKIEKIINLPFNSSEITENGFIVVNTGYRTKMYFQYYNVNNNDRIYNFSIEFIAVQAHKYASEKFTIEIMDSYDTLVVVDNSEWINNLITLNANIANIWEIKHFAIYLDSLGLYEFAAKELIISDIIEGEKEWII